MEQILPLNKTVVKVVLQKIQNSQNRICFARVFYSEVSEGKQLTVL